ncbi:hypothetical protein [Brevundimonas sp.]|uniref:hypothetical protein n=1 Tax=Brevundimonas sp. TaxID=1871086 RepID=UPI002FC84749
MAGPIHYEIYVRKHANAEWSLLMAHEDRRHSIDTAEEIIRDKIAAAVKVTKETLNPVTMEFSSISVLRLGAPDPVRKKARTEAPAGPACRAPAELYTVHARESLGAILEDWLRRQGVTAFELLHSPVLAERLDAAGVEVQHAIQKVAVPEAQATGQDLHSLLRLYQKLSDQTVEQIIKAGRRGDFIDPAVVPLAQIAENLQGDADRAFKMGGTIAHALNGLRGSRARLSALLDLCDQAPAGGALRAMVMVPVEQILCEMLAGSWNLPDLFGPSLDQGSTLAAVVRMVAPREVSAIVAHDPRLAMMVPPVEGPAARLGERLAVGEFPLVAAALAKMVLRELTSPRRLRPGDAEGEINILRALATSLTATAGRLLTLEEVQNAFIERSRLLVTADFVAAYVRGCHTVLEEAERLARLSDNVTGGTNKRSAARWLEACVSSLRFEAELCAATLPPLHRLMALRRLQRAIEGAGLAGKSAENTTETLGRIGTKIAEETRLISQIAKASVPLQQKLSALLRLAAADAAPVGKVNDMARAEAMRLLRLPETRQQMLASPEMVSALLPMMKAAGLAA